MSEKNRISKINIQYPICQKIPNIQNKYQTSTMSINIQNTQKIKKYPICQKIKTIQNKYKISNMSENTEYAKNIQSQYN